MNDIFMITTMLLFKSVSGKAHTMNHPETTASPHDIGIFGLESLLIALILFIIIAGLTALIYRQNKGRWDSFWNYLEHHLTHFFCIVWVFGFAVYLVGTSLTDEATTLIGYMGCLLCQAPMAFVHAFEMFILESDVSAIHSQFHNSLLFMSFFSLTHFLAVMVSMMFIIKYFGYNLVAKSRLMNAAGFKASFDELYVFWGMNEATYHLAKDIRKRYSAGNKTGTYTTIIMSTAEDDSLEVQKEHTALERLFSFISFNTEEINRYQELGCLTANVFKRLAKAKISDGSDACDILAGQMDAASLTKLINKTDKKVHFFFLGNDENDNIVCADMICHDKTIVDYCNNRGKVAVYCHARFNRINSVLEDKYSNENMDVKIIDSSRESINLFRSIEEYHPVHFVDIDTDYNYGTVKSGFYSMVIGFGETGRDAVRYLYEYAAFVRSDSSFEDDNPAMSEEEVKSHPVTRSHFRCYIIDKDAANLCGQFISDSPAVKGLYPINNDILSSDFYNNINPICKYLNYIVIALGNDELNIATAVRLFSYIRKNRVDMKHFRIFVRCHNHEKKKHLQQIANHYNQSGCGGFVSEYITIFGTEEQIYTYEKIIENDFSAEGHQYNAMYCEASGENGPKNRWESRRQILLKMRTLDALSELRRKESQDIANAYHALTKLFIMKKVSEDKGGDSRPEFRNIHDCLENMRLEPVFQPRAKSGKRVNGTISASGDYSSQEQLLFRNIARLEHLRWNAAHEVMGYQCYAKGDLLCELVNDQNKRHECNETYKLHNCLIDWQNLDAETNDDKNEWHSDYKLYDFIVISATLMLHNKRLKKTIC